MESDLSSCNNESPDKAVSLAVRLDFLVEMLLKSQAQFVLFVFLQDHYIYANQHLDHRFPQREYILKFLPFEMLDDELVEDAKLRKPHDVISEVVVETAERREHLHELQEDLHLGVLDDLVQLIDLI